MKTGYIAEIIARLGGLTKASKYTGVPISTLYLWREKGSYPAWRHPVMKKAARKAGIEIPKES